MGSKPKLWGKKGCPNRDEWGSEQSTNGTANNQQMGLQTMRKRDENKGKKKGSKAKLEKRAKLGTKL